MINIPDGVGGWLYSIIITIIKCSDGQGGYPQHHNHRWGWQRVIWLCLYHHHVMHVWRLFNYSIIKKPQLFFFQAIVMLQLHCNYNSATCLTEAQRFSKFRSKAKMSAVVEVDTSLVSKCMDFCQALASQGQAFNFSLSKSPWPSVLTSPSPQTPGGQAS